LIFDPLIAGVGSEVTPLEFEDKANASGACFGMTLGSPAHDNYKTHYFELLREASRRIKQRNAWYRALTYIKPSGANLKSHENRLPKSCTDCSICNPEVWATQGDYTPTALYAFYREQATLLQTEKLEHGMKKPEGWMDEPHESGKEQSVTSKDLAADDPRMTALQAYISHERRGVKLEPGKH